VSATYRNDVWDLGDELGLDPGQARLLFQALCGRELPFDPAIRRAWLPRLVATILVHPELELAQAFREAPLLSDPELGMPLLKALLEAEDDMVLWRVLGRSVEVEAVPEWLQPVVVVEGRAGRNRGTMQHGKWSSAPARPAPMPCWHCSIPAVLLVPRDLGLFDDQGYPLPIQERERWARLRAWLDDNRAVLDFVFPSGLPKDDRRCLEQDLELLKRQPWSPQAAIDAVLEDWPASEPRRPYGREVSEQRMIEACRRLLEEAKPGAKT
jgi:hypothetical protein